MVDPTTNTSSPNPSPTPATPAKGPTTTGETGASPRPAEPTKGPADPAAQASTTDAVKNKADNLRGKATDKAQAFAEQGKAKATEKLDGVSRMIDDAAAQVDDKLGAQYGDYARTAATAVSGFADTLRGKEIDDIVADARDFVRKSPVLAVGAAAAVGFLLARLARAGIEAADESADGGNASIDRGTGPSGA